MRIIYTTIILYTFKPTPAAKPGRKELVMFEYENDLLVVDELYHDPRYPNNPVVRIGENYYLLPSAPTKPIPENSLRKFKTKPAVTAQKASHSYEYLMYHTIPRNGFEVTVGREATPEEIEEIIREHGLTEDDISQEFDDEKGTIYGDKYKKKYKSVQVRVPNDEAIPLEQKLRDKGIEASNGSPGRVNIRTEWGGKRPGAGRPSTGRKKRTLYITDEEYNKLKEYLQSLR